ncbi:UDP-glucoronosyl and UDP-glucosyl transferase, partial [Ostertagia ostertagi]
VTLQPVLIAHLVGNGTTKSRLIQINPSTKLIDSVNAHLNGAAKRNLWTDDPSNPFGLLSFLPTLTRVMHRSTIELLDNKNLLQQLESEKFDVAITELFEFIGFGVLEAINVKNIVGVHTIGSLMERTSVAIGQPLLPSFVPASFGITGDCIDVWTRAQNLLFTIVSWKWQSDIASVVEEAMREKLGPTATPIWDTVSNISWFLVNSEPFLDFDRPTLHKIVHIGGLGVREPKPLNEVLLNSVFKFSAECENIELSNGIKPRNVLLSFGTVAPTRTMPAEIKKTIVDVVKSYPDITFIWRYEQLDDPLVAGVENVVVSKWIPQTDLLADERLTLFVTHGGAGSMMESATFGKPLVVVPLFGDQIRNAKLIEKFGFGVVVEKSQLLHGNVLNESLNIVLNDPRYRSAAHRMRSLLSQRQFTPQQKLVRTVELAAQFGDLPEFKVTGRNLGFVIYYNLDLIVMMCGIVVLIVILFIYLSHSLLRLCLPSAK